MPMLVIDLLKVIEINHDDGERTFAHRAGNVQAARSDSTPGLLLAKNAINTVDHIMTGESEV